MSSVVNTGTLSKLLWPGVSTVYGMAEKDFEKEYSKVFKVESMDRFMVEDQGFEGFGLLQVKSEGAPIQYDTMKQAYRSTYRAVVYSSGFMVTREAYEDNLYKDQINLKASALAKATNQTKETIAFNVINRAFTNTFTGGDGVELISASHPNASGGTRSNILTTAANLSEAALEDICIQIENMLDPRGLKMKMTPDKLLLPTSYMFEIDRILNSTKRVGTANNDKNSIAGKFPGGVMIGHYLTSTTAWFVLTSEKSNGLKFKVRRGDEFGSDNDWETENAKYKVTTRFVPGWTEWTHIFGTPGV